MLKSIEVAEYRRVLDPARQHCLIGASTVCSGSGQIGRTSLSRRVVALSQLRQGSSQLLIPLFYNAAANV